jgi:adenylate cyclase, class 2
MSNLNVEIKARCSDPGAIRNYLTLNNAAFKGLDLQTDTYFNVPHGRLKLREGNIENNLIFYERSDQQGLKDSHFQLVKVADPKNLREALAKAIGIKTVVEKKREIWFIENVKFHIDEVPVLGNFVEIEASNLYDDRPEEELRQQCNFYLKEFGIKDEDLVAASYSDLLMETI